MLRVPTRRARTRLGGGPPPQAKAPDGTLGFPPGWRQLLSQAHDDEEDDEEEDEGAAGEGAAKE